MVLVGKSGDGRRLQRTFASEREAHEAAQSEWNRFQRDSGTLSLRLSMEPPSVYPEQAIIDIERVNAYVSATSWLAARVTRELGNAGFMTSSQR